jgi:hypothetical protein
LIDITLALSAAAFYLAHGDLARMRAGAMDPDGEAPARAARALGGTAAVLARAALLLAALMLLGFAPCRGRRRVPRPLGAQHPTTPAGRGRQGQLG